MKDRLSEFEPFITMKARNIAYNNNDIEDFAQEGRIAAWKALQKDPSGTKSYVQKAVEWRMIDYARKVYAHIEVGYTPAMENMLYGNYGEDLTQD
jgi:DNA-directed RNA polymerase specialized sigma24 family protein